MGKQYEKKITWVIKDFSSLESETTICSDQFVVGGCKWYLEAYPKGYMVDDYLSLFLRVPDYISLPSGWRRHARYIFNIVDQRSEKISPQKELEHWFDEKSTSWGCGSMFPLNELNAKDSGFLVNGELKIVAEIQVLQIIGKLDVIKETSTIFETIDVNGFQLLPSQVEVVRRIFERHPEIASEFRPKKASIRTAYISLLVSLVGTMCQLPQETSKDDLSDAYTGLRSMKDAGFKLDWLEKKLDEMWEQKEKEVAGETRMQEIVEKLKDLKQMYSDLEAELEKVKAEVSAAKASFSFDDII